MPADWKALPLPLSRRTPTCVSLNVIGNIVFTLNHVHCNLSIVHSGVARIFCGEVLFTNKRNFFVICGRKKMNATEYRMVLSVLAYRLVKLDILTSCIE